LLITNSDNGKDEATVTWATELTNVKTEATASKEKYAAFWSALKEMDGKRMTFTA
jgi:hypothetical protein